MRSGTKKATIDKYNTALRLLVSRINRGEKISKRSFTTEFHLSHNFIRACVDLGYIEDNGKGMLKSKLIIVQPIHARKILDHLSKYTTVQKKKTSTNNLSIAFDDYASKLSNGDLINELKKRGFKGKLKREIVETTEL